MMVMRQEHTEEDEKGKCKACTGMREASIPKDDDFVHTANSSK